jgi:hypothetical protein
MGLILRPNGKSGLEVYVDADFVGNWDQEDTESEYTGASYALQEAIPIMDLLKEMKKQGALIGLYKAKVHCKLYEDNSGALEILKKAKYRPRMRQLLVKLHHFKDYVTRGNITIHAIRTHDQEADYLTKPVGEDIIKKLRHKVQGW